MKRQKEVYKCKCNDVIIALGASEDEIHIKVDGCIRYTVIAVDDLKKAIKKFGIKL